MTPITDRLERTIAFLHVVAYGPDPAPRNTADSLLREWVAALTPTPEKNDADEEMVPHPFRPRPHSIWCADCEYHRDHAVHLTPTPTPQEEEDVMLNMPVWKCKTCGCLWRDNLDGTMSLLDAEQKSCAKCEHSPTSMACAIHWLSVEVAQSSNARLTEDAHGEKK